MVRRAWPVRGSIVSISPGSPIATWTRPLDGLKKVTSGAPAIGQVLVTSPELPQRDPANRPQLGNPMAEQPVMTHYALDEDAHSGR